MILAKFPLDNGHYISADKKVITCVVLVAMLISIMAVACVAAMLAPKASADKMNQDGGMPYTTGEKLVLSETPTFDHNDGGAIYYDGNVVNYNGTDEWKNQNGGTLYLSGDRPTLSQPPTPDHNDGGAIYYDGNVVNYNGTDD